MITLLYFCLACPIAAAVLLMLFRNSLSGSRTARWIALGGSLITLTAAVALVHEYRSAPQTPSNGSPVQPKVEQRVAWFTPQTSTGGVPVRLEMHFGLDGISVAMIALTALLTVSSILISWESITDREADFYTALMILETGLVGVFCAFDVVMFYVFFELTLIPLFFLIALWGGPQKRYAAIKFFLYTLAGSLVTLLGLVSLVLITSSAGLATPCSIPDLANWLQAHPLSSSQQLVLFFMLSAGFLIKVPVFPFHTWLPLAHVEAPTAGSVLLAGVLLKLGSFGFLRICLPMLPEACFNMGLPLIGLLSVIGIIYGSLCALAQRDIKKLVAYSSVAHLGFCMLGLFALNVEGLTGGVLQMINHGLSTGALFLLVGMVYDRYHTRQMDDLGGLASRLPLIACSMVFISMASIGLPGLNGFVGEFLSLAGMFKQHILYTVLGSLGVVLGAWYLLTMVQFAFFGKLKEPAHGEHHIEDMNLREFSSLIPLAVLCLALGVYPAPLIELIEPDVAAVAKLYDKTAPQVAEQTESEQSSVPTADRQVTSLHTLDTPSHPSERVALHAQLARTVAHD
ncbi:complex I subunit 4 family protein [Planctomicrobium sp. SH664]|uniref:complex I subunit 4 family protein n=1 Tax=Planctomicrobium sp. SH664 TaxID=3448125 RepID=UPI003F5BBF1D